MLFGKRHGFKMLNAMLPLLLILAACGPELNSDSNLSHNAGLVTNGDYSLKWHDVTDQQLRDVKAPLVQMASGSPFPVATVPMNDPIVERLQYWLDQLDNRLRQEHPEQLEGVPVPRVQVIMNETPNAFVMPMPVCVDVRVELPSRPGANADTQSVALSAAGTVVAAWNRNVCVQKGRDLDYIQAWITQFNEQGGACQATLVGTSQSPRVRLNQGCEVEPRLAQVRAAQRLVFYPTSSIISVHAGLLTLMDEMEVVSVLLHELGHYYKSHPDRSEPEKYDYFYEVPLHGNHDHMPVENPELREFGQTLAKLQLVTRRYRQVSGQQIRSELYLPLLRMVSTIDAAQDCSSSDQCNFACREANRLANSLEYRQSLGRFPFVALDAAAEQQYSRFVTHAQSCLSRVALSQQADSDSRHGRAMSTTDFAAALVEDQALAPYFEGNETKQTVWESVLNVGQVLALNEQKAMEPLLNAKEQGLGYYTVEQEADDLSVEWLMLLGYDETPAVLAEFALGRFVESRLSASGVGLYPTQVPMDRCKELYENGWRDERGTPVRIPVADYIGTHHSTCFRVFNITREVLAHGFLPRPDKVQIPTVGGAWPEVTARTQRFIEQSRGGGKPEGMAAMAYETLPMVTTDFVLHRCRFSHL